MVTAATLPHGLADDEFWDGESSVRLITWLHVAVTAGFLAIVLGVTTKALTAGSSHVIALGWIAIGLGAATVTLGAAYVCLDALVTPPMALPSPAGPSAAGPSAAGPSAAGPSAAGPSAAAPSAIGPGLRAVADKLRGLAAYLLVPAIVALIASGVFAWLQPGGPAAAGGGTAGDGQRDRLDDAGDRGGAGRRADLHAARPARRPGNPDRRSLGHADAGVQHAEHRHARRGDLGGAPGGPGDQ